MKSKTNRKRKGKVGNNWYGVLASCLGTVAEGLADKTLVEFTTEEIETYLEERMDDDDWEPRTFNNYCDYIASVFKWGIENNKVSQNPVKKIEQYDKKMIHKEVVVPDVGIIARILSLTKKKYRRLRPALDLGFGLAMRSSEISRMDWANVRKQLIHVPASIAKNGEPRNIERSPLLDGVFRSLHSMHQTSGPIMYKGWRRDLTRLYEEAGIGKARNVARKSGATYHYHATGDEALTRKNMGHTQNSAVFSSSYKALNLSDGATMTPIEKTDGMAYFALWKKH